MSANLTHADWQRLAGELSFETRALIGDAFVDGRQRRDLRHRQPGHRPDAGRGGGGDTPDVEAAVRHAREAFDRGDWSRLAPGARKQTMLRLAALMEQHINELALLDTLDMGKPVTSSLGDMAGAIGCIRYNAETIDKLYGEVAPTGEESLGLVLREPLGVVGSIVPWNFPLMMTAWKIGPALAAGNSVILKPSEKSPLSALRLAQLAQASRPARRRVPGAAGIRPYRRQGAGAVDGCRLPVVHRLHRGRQAAHAVCRPVESEARLSRVRRQEPQPGVRRLQGSRRRGPSCRRGDLP